MPSSKSLWCDQKIYVTLHDDTRARSLTIDKPFAIVGTHRKCDVVIEDDSVSSRFLYLHATPNGLYCLPLNDKSDSLKPHWLEKDEEVICGRIRLQASTDSSAPTSSDHVRPDIGAYGSTVEPIPELLIEQGKKDEKKRIASRRARAILTVVGRSEPSLLRVPSSSLSRCHTALFWDANKLWAIDLLSTNHTYIDRRRAVVGELPLGSTMRLGEFLFTFQGFKEKDSEIQKAETPVAEAVVVESEPARSNSDSHVTSRSGVLQEASPDGSGLSSGSAPSFELTEPNQDEVASASDSHRNGSSVRRGGLDVPDTEPRITPGAVAESAEVAVAIEKARADEQERAAADREKLERELESLRAELAEKTKLESVLVDEKNELSEEVARIKASNKELEEKAEKAEQLEKTLEASSAEKELEAEAQTQVLADAEAAKALAEQSVADATKEIESLRKRVADLAPLEKMAGELTARVSELEAESEELVRRLSDVDEERQKLVEEGARTESLQAEIERSQKQLEEQAEESLRVQAELSEAREERIARERELAEEVEDAKQQLASLQSENQKLQSEIPEEVQQSFEEAERRYSNQIADLDAKLSESRLELQRMSELDSKQKELVSKNEELDSLYESAKKRLTTQAEELKELDSIRETRDSLTASNSELQAKVNEQELALESQAGVFEAEIEKHRHEAHKEMEESLSDALKSWNAERDRLKGELASKDVMLADSEKRIAESDEKLAAAAVRIAESEEVKEKLDLLTEKYTKEREEKKAAEVSVSKAKEAFQKERDKLQAESASERDNIESARTELEQRLADAEKALLEKTQSLTSKDQDLESVRSKLQATEKEVANATERSENQNSEICLLRQELADAQRHASAERSDREKALLENEQKEKELEKTLEEAQLHADEFKKELESRTNELAELELRFEERSRELGEGQKQSVDTQKRLADLEELVKQREVDVEAAHRELSAAKETAKTALVAFDAEKNDLKGSLESIQRQLDENEKSFQEREKGLVEFIEELESEQQARDGQSERLMALEVELEDAKSELLLARQQSGKAEADKKDEIEQLSQQMEKQATQLSKAEKELKSAIGEAKDAAELKKKNDGMTAELAGMRAQIAVAKSAVEELGTLQGKLAKETSEREAAEEMLKQLDEEWTAKQDASRSEAKRLQTLWEDARSKWEDQSKQAEKRIDRLVKENKRLDESLSMAREETARALKRAASSTNAADRLKKTAEMGEEEISHAAKLDSREVSPISPKSTEHIPTVEMDDVPAEVDNTPMSPPTPKPFELGAPKEDYTPGYQDDQDSRDPYADMEVLDEVAASLSAFGHSKRRQQKPLIISFLILLFWLVALSLLFGLSWVLVNAWLEHQNKAGEEDGGEDDQTRVTISAPYEVG